MWVNTVNYMLTSHAFTSSHILTHCADFPITSQSDPLILGFDRARSREVGKKNIELSTMEEAFTSEHWIVRIYKVKPRANLTPTATAAKKKTATGAGGKGKSKSGTSQVCGNVVIIDDVL